MAVNSQTLNTLVTYLEMNSKPNRANLRVPDLKISLKHIEKPTISFYRYLYDSTGEDWLWYERRVMSDSDLANIIQNKDVEVYVLSIGDSPAGLGELDRRSSNDIKLAHFGLLPEFIGRGLGHYFLCWLIDQAWSYMPQRVWLHTCDLDHPNALPLYQKAGFIPYRRETETFKNPCAAGLFPNWVDSRPG